MTKKKLVPIIASCIIVVGIVLAVIGYMSGAVFTVVTTKDGLKVIDWKEIEVETQSLDAFSDIDANLTDTDIKIIPSNDYKIKISKHKELDKEFTYKVDNNKLIIESKGLLESNKGLINITIGGIPQTKIEIYVPQDTTLKNVTVDNKFGDTHLDGLNSDTLKLDSQDADLSFKDINTNSFEIKNNFGDIVANSVTTKALSIDMKDGDLEFSSVDANSTDITNQFGDVTLRDFNSEGLNIKGTDGDIDVDGLLLGKSMISSNFGDIKVRVSNKESELSYNIDNKFGDITVNSNEYKTNANRQVKTENNLDMNAKDGDIYLHF
ncbi:DUF4097 family beta strand repeat-containing protein [Bacillus sp. JJ722]|uniref:DUF4097 family beta strand repeat-containing protein n=1 Tax=Bacillus sp. JJ722 TaxID=3122973 RepID=UPI002FFEEC82